MGRALDDYGIVSSALETPGQGQAGDSGTADENSHKRLMNLPNDAALVPGIPARNYSTRRRERRLMQHASCRYEARLWRAG